jgi:hypothetical protein
VVNNIPNHDEQGIYIFTWTDENFKRAKDKMANILFGVVQKTRRERIALGYQCGAVSLHFD